jgi:hypothetical protein
MQKARDLVRAGRSESLTRTLEPQQGWIIYFRLTETPGCRRNSIVGCGGADAACCGGDGDGPSRNAGASHMDLTLPAKYFTSKGLVSLMVGLAFRLMVGTGLCPSPA